MPIRKTEFKKGKIFHIFNRGAGGKEIFLNENNKERFFQSIFLANNVNSFRGISELEKNRKSIPILEIEKILKNKKIKIKPLVRIYSVCLMPNHFHFILKENIKNGIVKFMQKLCNSYGKYFSKNQNQKGPVFSGRFKAAQIENNRQLDYLLAYINVINPGQLIEPYLKIKGVENFSLIWGTIEKYKWSSHFDFIGTRDSSVVDKSLFLKEFKSPKNYLNFSREILSGKRNDMWNIIDKISFD